MANREQVLDVLDTLTSAYPGKTHDRSTLELYVKYLADIPSGLLERAARRHIQTSSWFPRIAQLRGEAEQLTGRDGSANLEPNPGASLISQALSLENDFYRSGVVDVSSWEQLARGFENASRFHRAQHTRTKLQRLQRIAKGSKVISSFSPGAFTGWNPVLSRVDFNPCIGGNGEIPDDRE